MRPGGGMQGRQGHRQRAVRGGALGEGSRTVRCCCGPLAGRSTWNTAAPCLPPGRLESRMFPKSQMTPYQAVPICQTVRTCRAVPVCPVVGTCQVGRTCRVARERACREMRCAEPRAPYTAMAVRRTPPACIEIRILPSPRQRLTECADLPDHAGFPGGASLLGPVRRAGESGQKDQERAGRARPRAGLEKRGSKK